jgi:hypothetical protein
MCELREMERQRRGQHPEALGDHTGWQTFGAEGNKQPEQVQPGLLGERAKCSDCPLLIHLALRLDISSIVEILAPSQHVNYNSAIIETSRRYRLSKRGEIGFMRRL